MSLLLLRCALLQGHCYPAVSRGMLQWALLLLLRILCRLAFLRSQIRGCPPPAKEGDELLSS